MKTYETIFRLRNNIPGPQLSDVVRAFSREPLVWQAIQIPEVIDRALEVFNGKSSLWTPGNLALVCLDVNFTSLELNSEPPLPLEPELKRTALEAYENYRGENCPLLTQLAEAGLVALAIRERFRILGTWDGIIQELDTFPGQNLGIILTCLLAYISDSDSLVALLAGERGYLLQTANAIYAQPASRSRHAHLSASLFTQANYSERINVLRIFENKFPKDSVFLAQELYHQEKLGYLPEDSPNSVITASNNFELEMLPGKLYRAEVCRIAGKPGLAFQTLEQITHQLNNIQNEINRKSILEAYAAGSLQITDDYLNNLAAALPSDESFLVEYGLLLVSHQEEERARQLLNTHPGAPCLQLVEAALLQRHGNIQQARSTIRKMFDTTRINLRLSYQAAIIAGSLLIDLDLPYEASQIIAINVSYPTCDSQSTLLLARAELAAGLASDALEHARLAVMLSPAEPEAHRLLADCYEQNQCWVEAFQERKSLLDTSSENHSNTSKSANTSFDTHKDQRSFAYSALLAGHVDQALETCWNLLSSEPDDGLTHHILGTIFTRKGESEIALQHYLQANQLAPDYAPAWLALASHYVQADDLDKAIETLRTAVQALPDDPQLHLALGEYLIEDELPTQALGELKKAADLVGIPHPVKAEMFASANQSDNLVHVSPLAAQILLTLGPVLLELGQAQEACDLLNPVYHCQPYRNEAAYPFARALAATGKERDALAALSTAYHARQNDPGLALEYARLMAKTGENPEQTVKVLEKLLDENPQLTEAIGLQAEALAAIKRFPESLNFYQKAMETTLMGDPRWATRLALGLSQVAIQVEHTDIAIAALQEAIQASPNHLALQQKLSEACLAANLPEDALDAAERALEIAPANLENLVWYARQMDALDHPQQSVSALESAVDLSPNNPALLINLGQAYMDLRHHEKAHGSYLHAVQQADITLDQLYDAASALMVLGDTEQVVVSLEKVHDLALHSNDLVGNHILFALIDAYRTLGNSTSAMQILDELLEKSPNSVQALLQKAQIHKSEGQMAPALACLKQVLMVNPDSVQAHLLATEFYRSVGNLFVALEHARQACQSTNNEDLIAAALIASELAWQLYLPDEAQAYLTLIEATRPDQFGQVPEIKKRLLQCLIEGNQAEHSASIELAEYLKQNRQEGPSVHAINALIFARQDEITQAEREIDLSLQRLESDHLLKDLHLDLLCEISFGLGLFQKSLEIAEQWLDASPANPRATASHIRAIVSTMEYNLLLAELKATPLDDKLNGSANQNFSQIDQLFGKLLVQMGLPADLDAEQIINHTALPDALKRWYIRAHAVISAKNSQGRAQENIFLNGFANLELTCDDAAAYIAALRHQGKVDSAINIASSYPNHTGVAIQLALTYILNSPLQALGAALSAVETVSSNLDRQKLPIMNAMIAKAAELTGEPAQAYQAIETALGDWPDQAAWQKFASDVAVKLGKLSEAQQHLEKAHSINPKNEDYLLALGELYYENGAINRCQQIYESACEQYPTEARYWIRLAQIRSDLDDLEGSGNALEKALGLQPNDPNTLLLSAELMYRRKEFDQAISQANSALNLEPENPAAAFLLARSLTGLNRRQEAMAILDQALTYSNRPIDLYLERIRLVRSLQGLQPAHQSLLALNRQYPDHPAILAQLAEYYQDQGLSQDAYSTAQKAIQIGDGHLRTDEFARLHTIMGRILSRAGHLDQAVHQYTLAMEINPRQVELYLELGKVHQDRRQLNDALDIYEKAIYVAPNDPRPYQQAGIALKESKDYPGAEKMIRRAAELAPHDISIHRLLGSLVALNLVHNIQ